MYMTYVKLTKNTVQFRYKRITHTCTIRVYFAHTRMSIHAHMRVYVRIYMCVYVSLTFIPISFFTWNIVGQTKDIPGMKKRQISTRNLHIVKKVYESLDVSSFWSLCKFTNKLLFINTCLIFSCQEVGKKIETVAYTPFFNKLFSFTEYFM